VKAPTLSGISPERKKLFKIFPEKYLCLFFKYSIAFTPIYSNWTDCRNEKILRFCVYFGLAQLTASFVLNFRFHALNYFSRLQV
jgi:hypothetical protein